MPKILRPFSSFFCRALKRRLKTTRRKANERIISTDGVFIEEMSIDISWGDKKPVSQPCTVAFWDFSRQGPKNPLLPVFYRLLTLEIRLGSSQLYFTDHCLYLVVINLQEDDLDHSVDYWLQAIADRTSQPRSSVRIRYFTKKAHIIHLAGRIDEPDCNCGHSRGPLREC